MSGVDDIKKAIQLTMNTPNIKKGGKSANIPKKSVQSQSTLTISGVVDMKKSANLMVSKSRSIPKTPVKSNMPRTPSKFKKSDYWMTNSKGEDKMDMAKALLIMGFKNTQWADKKAGFNPKEELDKAHIEKMVEITMNWKVMSECHSDLECSKVCFCHCF